jgi:hypothetical protein
VQIRDDGVEIVQGSASSALFQAAFITQFFTPVA